MLYIKELVLKFKTPPKFLYYPVLIYPKFQNSRGQISVTWQIIIVFPETVFY